MKRPPAPEIRTALGGHHLFGVWPSWAQGLLGETAGIRHYRKGRRILSAGEDSSDLLVVLKGAVFMGLNSGGGKKLTLSLMPPGSILALIPSVDDAQFICDLYAHQQTSLLHIPRETLWRVLARDPRLTAQLLDWLCRISREFIGQSLRHRLMENPRERLIDVLLHLACYYGKATDRGLALDIRLSQDDLGAMLSLSRQSINKELRLLVEEGLIATHYGTITLLEVERLHRINQRADLPRSQPPFGRSPLLDVLGIGAQGEP